MQFDIGVLDLASGGLPSPHLREHLVSGIPITVYYSNEAGSNVVGRYIDAPP